MNIGSSEKTAEPTGGRAGKEAVLFARRTRNLDFQQSRRRVVPRRRGVSERLLRRVSAGAARRAGCAAAGARATLRACGAAAGRSGAGAGRPGVAAHAAAHVAALGAGPAAAARAELPVPMPLLPVPIRRSCAGAAGAGPTCGAGATGPNRRRPPAPPPPAPPAACASAVPPVSATTQAAIAMFLIVRMIFVPRSCCRRMPRITVQAIQTPVPSPVSRTLACAPGGPTGSACPAEIAALRPRRPALPRLFPGTRLAKALAEHSRNCRPMDNITNIALSRLAAQTRAMDVVANNLANASTPATAPSAPCSPTG